MRETQKGKALSIENKRRQAKGEELLTSLDADEEEEAEVGEAVGGETSGDNSASENAVANADSESEAEAEVESTPDVLLTEAGNVLVDTLLMNQQHYAVNEKED